MKSISMRMTLSEVATEWTPSAFREAAPPQAEAWTYGSCPPIYCCQSRAPLRTPGHSPRLHLSLGSCPARHARPCLVGAYSFLKTGRQTHAARGRRPPPNEPCSQVGARTMHRQSNALKAGNRAAALYASHIDTRVSHAPSRCDAQGWSCATPEDGEL